MTEVWAILALFILLFGIVSLRFCFLLHNLKNREENERKAYDEEWQNAEYYRYWQHYED